ncbi:MAG: hypothetical protein ABEJ99_05805 [Candidatus Nanohaloarchaea archaeon]
MGAFASIVETMMGMNIFHLFFPWLMMLAIIYGALNKADFFEEQSVNGVLSFSVATLAMGGIYLFVPEGVFTNFAAVIAFSTFAIFGFVILLTMAGVDVGQYTEIEGNFAALGAIIFIVIGIIGTLITQVDIDLGTGSGSLFDGVVMPILVLVFLIIVISLVTPSE